MMIPQAGPPAAHAFLDFVNASPTPFHAVHVAARRLEKSGFRKVMGPCVRLYRITSYGICGFQVEGA